MVNVIRLGLGDSYHTKWSSSRVELAYLTLHNVSLRYTAPEFCQARIPEKQAIRSKANNTRMLKVWRYLKTHRVNYATLRQIENEGNSKRPFHSFMCPTYNSQNSMLFTACCSILLVTASRQYSRLSFFFYLAQNNVIFVRLQPHATCLSLLNFFLLCFLVVQSLWHPLGKTVGYTQPRCCGKERRCWCRNTGRISNLINRQ